MPSIIVVPNSRGNRIIKEHDYLRRLTSFSNGLTGELELGKAYVLYSVSLIFIFPGEIPSSDSTKSSSFSTFFFEKGVWHKGGCNFK